ncbi:MAG: GNAT family N-acetyltransferase [Vicinamibacterales bacterium]
MSSYRFCRTDDIALLVGALNACWQAAFPDEPPETAAAFKRSIRDLQVWCSSCMVAFSGAEPIGVLIGAKRPSGTLIHRIAVHPAHRRQGHGRHLLTSLSSKLAILGPPRMVAEVPEALAPACALFGASGYVPEAVLVDYVLQPDVSDGREGTGAPDGHDGRFLIPVTVDDLVANGHLGETHAPVCWTRSPETILAMKDEVAGFAVASDERIEAYVLFTPSGVGEATVLALRAFVDAGAELLRWLLARLRAQGLATLRLPRVHPAEIPGEWLAALGFRPAGRHLLYAGVARPA